MGRFRASWPGEKSLYLIARGLSNLTGSRCQLKFFYVLATRPLLTWRLGA